MTSNLPPDEQSLFKTYTSIRFGADPKPVLSGYIRGLISPTNAQAFYTSYATILKSAKDKLSAAEVINIIDGTLADASPGSDASKREKKLLATARVLALGGLVRSGKLTEPAQLDSLLKELASYCEHRRSVSLLASTFIISLLEQIPAEKKKNVSLTPIQDLLTKKFKNSIQLQIALEAYHLKLELDYTYLESIDSIIDTLLMHVQPDDVDTLQSLFKYLASADMLELFWTTFTSRLRRTHLSLLVACIGAALQQQCPASHLLSREIIVFLLETFRKVKTEDHQKAKEGFGLLLNWPLSEEDAEPETNPKHKKESKPPITLHRKERKHALKALFQGVPNALHEYKFLKLNLQYLIKCLTTKELDRVLKSIELNQTAGERLMIACNDFHCLLMASKNFSQNSKLKIMEDYFRIGFCQRLNEVAEAEADNQVTQAPTEMVVSRTKAAFKHFLGLEFEDEVLDQLFTLVQGIVSGKNEEWKLVNPVKVGAEIGKLWKKAPKLVKAGSNANPIAKKCLKLHLILSLVQSEPEVVSTDDELVTLTEICEGKVDDEEQDDEESPTHRLGEFIVNVLLEKENPIINYEPMLKILFQDQSVAASSLGMIQEVLDQEDDEQMEDDEDEDDSESDSDLEDEDNEENEDEDEDDHVTPKKKQIQKEAKPVVTSNGKSTSPGAGADSDSESSVDMDEATEEDLQQMDAALARVFSTKKKIKNSTELEIQKFMRACRVLDVALKSARVLDATLVPLILMPSLACFIKCSKQKNKASAPGHSSIAFQKYTRIRKIIDRMIKIREVDKAETVDKEILNGMVEDIEKYKKAKMERIVRNTLNKVVNMLKKCFGLDIEVQEEPIRKGKQKQKEEPKNSKKHQHTKQDKRTVASGSAKSTPKSKDFQDKNKTHKKKRKSAPDSMATIESKAMGNGNGVNHHSPSPAKKKRKSTVN